MLKAKKKQAQVINYSGLLINKIKNEKLRCYQERNTTYFLVVKPHLFKLSSIITFKRIKTLQNKV